MARFSCDAIVVGSGPNGLSAAIALAQAGVSVQVIEGSAVIGGGVRSEALTLPGFVHDVCSSVYPMAAVSPFLRQLPLEKHGLTWVYPEVACAHPLEDQEAAVLVGTVEETASRLGSDGPAYERLMGPLARQAEALFADLLGPLRFPRHPLLAARFGHRGLRSGRGLAEAYFRTVKGQALIAGLAAHAVLPLECRPGAAIALMLGLAGHVAGWPVARGGAQTLANALASYLQSLGGQIQTACWIQSWDDLPPARVVLLDLTPRQVLALAKDRLPGAYARRLSRYRYGPGVFKVDWALSGPIPWTDPACRKTATVHVGGTLDEIALAERAPFEARHVPRPFVLLTQPSVCDPTRAPNGQHTAWAYVHVPHGSTQDMTLPIEAQVERFAPGFRSLILARHVMNTQDMERHNPNYVGGDIGGGMADLWQLLTRPVPRWDPYSTPLPGVFLCSSSTPPGGGVHGLCGYFAAHSALRYLQRRR